MSMKFSFVNETNNKYPDDQIHIAIIGKQKGHDEHYRVEQNDALTVCQDSDNDIPGHLEKKGKNWCNYSRTLDKIREIEVSLIDSARVYISLGSPIYLQVIDNGKGLVQPNPVNPDDPNADVYFDWIEFTLDDSGFHGNTTQVDQFGFPMVIELTGSQGTKKAGIEKSRSTLFSEYKDNVPDQFKSLVQEPYRIIAPLHSGDFHTGGKNETYFNNYIEEMWRHYTSNELQLQIDQGKFTGKVENDILTFTKADSPNEKFQVKRPTSWDVFDCKNTLNEGNQIEQAIQAQIGAMFNRHILKDSANKCDPNMFYKEPPFNYYAQFWHPRSIDNKAYGFPYDDVCNQSTLLEDPHPQELKIRIRWD